MPWHKLSIWPRLSREAASSSAAWTSWRQTSRSTFMSATVPTLMMDVKDRNANKDMTLMGSQLIWLSSRRLRLVRSPTSFASSATRPTPSSWRASTFHVATITASTVSAGRSRSWLANRLCQVRMTGIKKMVSHYSTTARILSQMTLDSPRRRPIRPSSAPSAAPKSTYSNWPNFEQ